MRATLLVLSLLAGASFSGATDVPPPAARGGLPDPVEVPYTPPACVGIFPDVPCSHQFATWIEQLYRDRITTGCGGGNYCPDSFVTRGQMSAFLERMARGTERWKPNYAEVWQVSHGDGTPDPVASGQALRAAIAAIPSSGPMAPAVGNGYVVFIGPGTFDVGDQPFDIPHHVELRGAGRDATRIRLTGGIVPLNLKGYNRVSHLSVFQNSTIAVAYAVNVNGLVRLAELYVEASGGSGWNIGVYVTDGYVELSDSEVRAISGGASSGVYFAPTADGGEITNCRIHGVDGAVRLQTTLAEIVRIGFSRFETAPVIAGSPGIYLCHANVLFGSYAAATCP